MNETNEILELKVPLLFEAAMFAAKAHGAQKRGGSDTPYVYHVFDVARRVAKYGFLNTDVLLAAILHDTLEDTDATYEEISKKFSPRTAIIVEDLTLPPDAQKDRIKKQAFQIRKMRTMDYRGQAIKVADKTSNVYDLLVHPPPWGMNAIRGYSEGAREVVLSIIHESSPRPEDREGLHPGLNGLITEFLDTFDQVRVKYKWA